MDAIKKRALSLGTATTPTRKDDDEVELIVIERKSKFSVFNDLEAKPEPTQQQQGPPEKKIIYDPKNRWQGYMYQLIFVVLQCFNQFFGKALFTRHPDINISQLIIIRSFGAIIVLLVIMNKNFYHYMFKSVPRSLYSTLLNRCI